MKSNSKPKAKAFTIYFPTGKTSQITVKGRNLWALEQLLEAGPKGCTPIDTPGPRWSAYVLKLRKAGVEVETINEAHDGPYSGTHARYVLRSNVAPVLGEAA